MTLRDKLTFCWWILFNQNKINLYHTLLWKGLSPYFAFRETKRTKV